MAYINVIEWTPEQVIDWLKGLDDIMFNYTFSFTNNQVTGAQLLKIRSFELEQLGIYSIGHQETILEAVENLRNYHYNIDKENLQFLALHVATASRNLFNQLSACHKTDYIETEILNDIRRTITNIKPLVDWLDRPPFQAQLQYREVRKNVLQRGLEMATIAQRDRFVENPVQQIRTTAETLSNLADYIIQDITDPMVLQPAVLSLVTVKKRESELGFNIAPSYNGVLKVNSVKFNSPAHCTGNIEDWDEIVQINYQTVVAWQYKTVILHLRNSSPDVVLTLKKRPKHTKVYGQIYIKPYRLPSKKRSSSSRWDENLLYSKNEHFNPTAFYQDDPLLSIELNKKTVLDSDSSGSESSERMDRKSPQKAVAVYIPKPLGVLHRRNTISGDEFSCYKKYSVTRLWSDKILHDEISSPSLRDKSISFGFGLEITTRPAATCIGASAQSKLQTVKSLKNSTAELNPELSRITNSAEGDIKTGLNKAVRFVNIENDSSYKNKLYAAEYLAGMSAQGAAKSKNSLFIRFSTTNECDKTKPCSRSDVKTDSPPAVEPRKEFLQIIPPIPPPRPKKTTSTTQPSNELSVSLPSTTVETELLTTSRKKSLTSKMKNHLIIKRRNIALKELGTGDIQGHLYKRKKDKQGVTYWAKSYFILIENVLYGLKNKQSKKPNIIIFLPGFTVSLAKEVHSKSYAFKVYHSVKSFYFAAETEEALNQWLDFIRRGVAMERVFWQRHLNSDPSAKELFSETESSESESDPDSSSRNYTTKSFNKYLELETLKPACNSSKHEKYFGSLKKLSKTTLLIGSEKKNLDETPIKTANFRSFRKFPGTFENANDLRIKTESIDEENTFAFPLPVATEGSDLRVPCTDQMVSNSLAQRSLPLNYIHASNPNLVEFDFQTSKTLDFSLPKINSSTPWDAHNAQNFLTLKDLMLKKQEEDAQDMYKNRVCLGVEKTNNTNQAFGRAFGYECDKPQKDYLAKIQSRSLPKTPDYAMSFKPDDEDIKIMRSKEGVKLRDFGYEFIYGDDSNAKNSTQKKDEDNSTDDVGKRGKFDDLKKTKKKFTALKSSSEKILHLIGSTHENQATIAKQINCSASYLPQKKSLSNDNYSYKTDKTKYSCRRICRSNEMVLLKREILPNTNAATPCPLLTKLKNSGNKNVREQKIMRSPSLHRVIFRCNKSSEAETDFGLFNSTISSQSLGMNSSVINDSIKEEDRKKETSSKSQEAAQTYPDLKCPPIFEPEIYSLSDPNASFTLLRRRKHKESQN